MPSALAAGLSWATRDGSQVGRVLFLSVPYRQVFRFHESVFRISGQSAQVSYG